MCERPAGCRGGAEAPGPPCMPDRPGDVAEVFAMPLKLLKEPRAGLLCARVVPSSFLLPSLRQPCLAKNPRRSRPRATHIEVQRQTAHSPVVIMLAQLDRATSPSQPRTLTPTRPPSYHPRPDNGDIPACSALRGAPDSGRPARRPWTVVRHRWTPAARLDKLLLRERFKDCNHLRRRVNRRGPGTPVA